MVEYHDLTLRDGCHAICHQLSPEMIVKHCQFAEEAGIPVVEVGHGNGLGASSILIGRALLSDHEMLSLARLHLSTTKLSCHVIPGLATVERDIEPAIRIGVDIFRIACHCTEATMTKAHIEYIASRGKTAYGALMMSATCTTEVLCDAVKKMKTYGAEAVIIMDSTGSFLPDDVRQCFTELSKIDIKLGFHAHNNLSLAVANSLAAIQSGAAIIDATVCGFGAGAGNTPLEVISTLYPCDNLHIIDCMRELNYPAPLTKTINILTAKYKLHSVFEKKIETTAKLYNLQLEPLVKALSAQNLVAGQEDLVDVIAASMSCSQQCSRKKAVEQCDELN